MSTWFGDYSNEIEYRVPYFSSNGVAYSLTGHSGHVAYDASSFPPFRTNFTFFANQWVMMMLYASVLWQSRFLQPKPFVTTTHVIDINHVKLTWQEATSSALA